MKKFSACKFLYDKAICLGSYNDELFNDKRGHNVQLYMHGIGVGNRIIRRTAIS